MTSIEWTDKTWNPVVGCSIVSPGCTNCYAMKMAARIEAMAYAAAGVGPLHYIGTTKKVNGNAVWTGKLALAPESTLLEPLRRKKPTMYFVNSMGDLFHEKVIWEWMIKTWAAMYLADQHIFQILTKRADNMQRIVSGDDFEREVKAAARVNAHYHGKTYTAREWPLPNVWLGVSTEDQKRADERIPLLLQTPAAVRFISAEPLLGPVNFLGIDAGNGETWDALRGNRCPQTHGVFDARFHAPAHLDWVIVGGESGPHARPMHPQWARDLRDQCAAAGVPFFFKQWGEWTPGENVERSRGTVEIASYFAGTWSFAKENLASEGGHYEDQPDVYRVGKKSAGRLLDGKEHNAFPQVNHA